MTKQERDLLEKYGFRLVATGGDPLRDVYEDLGARPVVRLTDTRKFITDKQKWIGNDKNPNYSKTLPNPNYNQAVTAREALESLVAIGTIDDSWLS